MKAAAPVTLALALLIASFSGEARAQDAAAAPKTEGHSATTDSEEDDFKQTPYTRFGEFQSDDEEAEDARFFQFGRFFGLGLGVGYEGSTGNRGTLYRGGFPALEAKVIYWFDFDTAMVLSVMNVKHSFTGQLDPDGGASETSTYDVNIFRVGADFRYYVETRDLSAPITFANPYLTVGIGNFRKTQTDIAGTDTKAEDSSFGFTAGGGFDFIVQPKKSYFNLEGRIHTVTFNDTGVKVRFTKKDLNDQSGIFFTIMGALVFTW